MIYHITTRKTWEEAERMGQYSSPSLAKEGFTHCCRVEQLKSIANFLFKGRKDLVIVELDEGYLRHELKYEGTEEKFPHVYGPINIDAAVRVIDFPSRDDGYFNLPQTLAEQIA